MGQTAFGLAYYFDIKTKNNNYHNIFNTFIVGKAYNVKK